VFSNPIKIFKNEELALQLEGITSHGILKYLSRLSHIKSSKQHL